MLDWRYCQENTWLDLHSKRSTWRRQHKMQQNFCIGTLVKTDVVPNLHGRDLEARLNFVNWDLHGYVPEKQAPTHILLGGEAWFHLSRYVTSDDMTFPLLLGAVTWY